MANNGKASVFIILLLIIAAILRLVHPFQIPMTYDEVTALIRTHYSTLSEEIRQGVMLHDTHPAGIQLFIYYWTMLFGYSEIVVKLPFIVFGILSVYCIYRIGRDWFNQTVGLVCAAFMATLQYPIMYSQEIRPYSSGLFLALVMVYYWNKVVFKPEKKILKNTCLYVIFSAFCAYDHHFDLLFSAIVGITGIFFIQKKFALKYILAGVAIFVLYIPHLHIFFYQLSQGGVGGPNGWLGKPQNTFILDYLYYIFHFSRSVIMLTISITLFGVYSSVKRGFAHRKYFIISLSWFLIPLLTGFFYSIMVNPVLQYSVLIFSFPFLLLSLFCWLPDLSYKGKSVALIIICFINIFTLVHSRKHYQLFYKAPYEQPILINDSLVKALGRNNLTSLIQEDDSDKNVSNYYIHKDHADTSFYWTDNLGCFITHPSNYPELIRFVPQQRKTYFAFGGAAQFDANILQIVSTYYPYLVKEWNFAGGSFFLFSNKQTSGSPDPYIFKSENSFEGPAKYWSEADPHLINDTIYYSGKHSYKIDNQHEWAPAFSCKLKEMSHEKNDIIQISLELYPLDTLTNVSIVSTLESEGKTIDWRETDVNKFIPDTLRNKWVKVYHTVKLQDINTGHNDIVIKVYIWNKGRKKFYMDDFTIKTFRGNPIIYGLLQKI